MNKATRIIGYVLVVSGLNVGLAAAQSAAPASNKFDPAKPVSGFVTGIVLSGIRPLIDPPSLGYRPVTVPPLRPILGVPRPGLVTGTPRPTTITGRPILGVFKPALGILPKPGTTPKPFDTYKPVTLSDVKGYDR